MIWYRLFISRRYTLFINNSQKDINVLVRNFLLVKRTSKTNELVTDTAPTSCGNAVQ